MNQDRFMAAVVEAQMLVGEVEDVYRVAAFQVALSHILRSQTEQTLRVMSTASSLSAQVSFEEFAARLPRSASHNDRFVAVAYYLAQSGVAAFRANEILEDYYPRARWVQRPRNASDVANQCAKKAYFELTGIDDKGMKLWRITRTGVKYVETLLLAEPEAEK